MLSLVRVGGSSINRLHGACPNRGLEVFQRCCVWSLAGRGVAVLGFQTGEECSSEKWYRTECSCCRWNAKHLESFKMPLFLSAAVQEKVETEEGGPEMEAHDVSAPYTSSNPLSSQPILS